MPGMWQAMVLLLLWIFLTFSGGHILPLHTVNVTSGKWLIPRENRGLKSYAKGLLQPPEQEPAASLGSPKHPATQGGDLSLTLALSPHWSLAERC